MTIYQGDMRGILPMLPADTFDSCVCDPPYNLDTIRKRFGGKDAAPAQFGTDGAYSRSSRGFMGKQWDNDIMADPEAWAAVYRTMKPGAILAAFSHARTHHRMATAIELAGFTIIDQIMWLYGSGFPKTHKIENGHRTALKPAHEPICIARKPISEKTNKLNFARWGTGGFNIDDCMVLDDELPKAFQKGRYPANVIHDGLPDDWARFFYCAKASKNERPWHCTACSVSGPHTAPRQCPNCDNPVSSHPTVKPQALMRYLCRLVTPAGGAILDPFAGSGSTIEAALAEGFAPTGIEMDPEYIHMINARLNR